MILFIEGVAGAWISECWVVRKREWEWVRVSAWEREMQRERNRERERERACKWVAIVIGCDSFEQETKIKNISHEVLLFRPPLSHSLTLSHPLSHSHTHSTRSHLLPRKNYFIHWACWLLERGKKWTGVNWPWRKTSKPNCVRVLLHLNGFY